MILGLHGLSTKHSNVWTDIRIAGETGYQGVEIVGWKLQRYVDAGLRIEDLLSLLDSHALRVFSVNDIEDAERQEAAERRALLAEAEWLCSAAEVLHCPTIQVTLASGLQGRPWREIVRLTARNVGAIADIGKKYGVRFKLEPMAWSPIHSLSQSLQLIEEVGRDNVGLSIDFWHLWAGEGTTPGEVAQLPSSLIYGVHFGDGLRHEEGTEWDQYELRAFLPGDGKIPIQEWVDAVRSTGYDGVWSCELISPKHWEWDLSDIARECRERMLRYL